MENMDDVINRRRLANNALSEPQRKILDRMNRVGIRAEITVKKAMEITGLSESGSRGVLNKLANYKG